MAREDSRPKLRVFNPSRKHDDPPPPNPGGKISHYPSRFRIEKCFWQPVMRPIVKIMDGGWMGTALRTHVVLCGFPRSGSTLLQLMIEACVSDVQTFGRERCSMEVAKYYVRRRPIVMSKRPSDIFAIKDLRKYYAGHAADLRVVLLTRDPRTVLTSHHYSRPDDYYVDVERWNAIYDHFRWARDAHDVTVVRYEDLVSQTDRVQRRLQEFIGWNVVRPFEDFHQAVPKKFDTRALNGVRQLDSANINRWRHPKYRERIRQLLLDELPDLPRYLVDMNYESDHRWTRDYVETATLPMRRAA